MGVGVGRLAPEFFERTLGSERLQPNTQLGPGAIGQVMAPLTFTRQRRLSDRESAAKPCVFRTRSRNIVTV